MKKCLMFFTGINVAATYFFLVLPKYYPIMISLYGYVPTGTDKGTAGYRAGIANHYSQNGIYISVFFMILMTLMLVKQQDKKGFIKRNKFLFVCVLLTFVALLLTGKRGVLMWSCLAIILTYMIQSKRKFSTIVKFVSIALLLYVALQVLISTVPAVGYVFERFESVGEDKASLERIEMWKLAINEFKNHPIFGNGFWKFKEFYRYNLAPIYHKNNALFQTLNAHNVYLQVLCETGIVGEIIYLFAVGGLLKRTVSLVQNADSEDDELHRFGALFSLCIQLYYLAYSLSGNCLYDIVFYFYAIAIGLTLSLSYEKSRKNKTGRKVLT